MYFKKGKIWLITIGLMVLLSACGGSNGTTSANQEDEASKGTINIGQISWAENIAVTNMWKVILEEEGYEVKFHLLDMGTQMAALENDALDINLEVWLPVQDKEYVEQYKDKVNFSEETWYDNAKVGLVVPSYLEEINSIEDLKKNSELFQGEITGFDPGAGTMLVTEEVIEEYDLDYELLSSSEPAMLTEIEAATENKEPIVAPLWNPHRVFSELDLKYLEDPKEVYGGVEKIYHATRLGFAEDFPEVSEWIKNWKMDDQSVGELMSYVNEAEENGEDPMVGAEKWIEDNEELVNEWVK
ncbi:glycine betaine ABC transporter substrate-binding protein [Oceanobacillus caeni]|uniref:glycine betaine ABC transporter substrate-binding protein n=1 Tax=Bacillaceae TaxID=186817 RepID=UPI0006223DC6|nr:MULTISPECIES: glycine betaine ABC transporter substrate-binding protein [Bacillaceae]KKE78494.1 glycine/betaine ABC transporter [Bacilli bacterium VT-13-104]PZD85418.1 glycine/betaine ABC transporter [Bacilli bacterium]MCR1836076.1 glycine betaine ABC transporter substrate-binding protein [Oceanobacillus caeni]MED4474521.1 glycine betaine ABC transporter substrate-binding protein [Oceanobacillus caeni]PZD89142.1 glycine/betaine ABC transporter [Bacilli bacterium]